jgi:predicted DsbA family dithiol-disulfide isomerase
VWLDQVKQEYGDNLQINWRHFSLEQINSRNGPDWKVWEQMDVREARALLASVAGEAAKRQNDPEAFDRFHLALLTARHAGDRLPLNEDEPLIAIAEQAGLDVEQFKKDLDDPDVLAAVAADHEAATTQENGVFGTPTFLFENGHTAYMKTFIPPKGEAVEVFDSFVSLFGGRTYIGEIKSPQPPWPKGAVD